MSGRAGGPAIIRGCPPPTLDTADAASVVPVRLDPELEEALRHRAEADHSNVSEIIRRRTHSAPGSRPPEKPPHLPPRAGDPHSLFTAYDSTVERTPGRLLHRIDGRSMVEGSNRNVSRSAWTPSDDVAKVRLARRTASAERGFSRASLS